MTSLSGNESLRIHFLALGPAVVVFGREPDALPRAISFASCLHNSWPSSPWAGRPRGTASMFSTRPPCLLAVDELGRRP